jgi:hypothetical protein
VIVFLTPTLQFFSYIMVGTPIFQSDDDVRFALELTETTIRGEICRITQPVFALSPYCCMLSRVATNTNFTVFWFYCTRSISIITPPTWFSLVFF